MKRVAAALLALLLYGAGPVTDACRMGSSDAAWLDVALKRWHRAETRLLKLAPAPLPTIVVADAACTYTGRADSAGRLRWQGLKRQGPVLMPDGKSVPLGPISFAAPDNGAAGTGYFAMSLPSVWRSAGVTSGLGLETMMGGVLLHELMHTRQFYFANPRLAELSRRYGLPDSIGDDSLQDQFARDPAYVAAYERERDLLFAAAAAPDAATARRLAAEALAAMRARRAHWFIGGAEKWAPLDDLFLDMEGLGQWLAYASLTSGTGRDRAVVLREVRRGGKYWSQDEGLAMFLVVDRLLPGWQALAFADPPLLAEALLARAVSR